MVLAVAILFAGSLAASLLWLLPATFPYQQPDTSGLGTSVALMVLSHVLASIAVPVGLVCRRFTVVLLVRYRRRQ